MFIPASVPRYTRGYVELAAEKQIKSSLSTLRTAKNMTKKSSVRRFYAWVVLSQTNLTTTAAIPQESDLPAAHLAKSDPVSL